MLVLIRSSCLANRSDIHSAANRSWLLVAAESRVQSGTLAELMSSSSGQPGMSSLVAGAESDRSGLWSDPASEDDGGAAVKQESKDCTTRGVSRSSHPSDRGPGGDSFTPLSLMIGPLYRVSDSPPN